MKRQVRREVFETNSSATHAISMCSGNDYEKWENGEVLYWKNEDIFGTKEEIINKLKEERDWNGKLLYGNVNWEDKDEVDDVFLDEGIKSYEEYFENEEFETYEEKYKTENGEEVVAF